MADVAADVPGKYDIVIDGHGYILANTLPQSSASYSAQRASYSFSPTFVERTNVTGDYGDGQQDFWLTWSQRDWSLGEQQKYYRSNQGRSQRYYAGTNVDVRTAGEVTLRRAVKTETFAGAVRAVSSQNAHTAQQAVAASSTNLYLIGNNGAIVDNGAHGLGAAPGQFGIANDVNNTYLTTTTAGTVGVRRWDGGSFTTFSATACDSLAYLNNSLYGFRVQNVGDLLRYDTTGVATTLALWKDSRGQPILPTNVRLKPFGGKLLILRQSGSRGSELWIYDGNGVAQIAEFPVNFVAHDMEVILGVVYISGSFIRHNASSNDYRPAILYYASGNVGVLWQANSYLTISGSFAIGGHPAVAPLDGGLMFTDDTRGAFMYYEPSTGGVHATGSYTVSGDTPLAAGCSAFAVYTRNSTTGYFLPDISLYATTGTITHSLVDFDSSLTKSFKALVVDYDPATDGDGGSITAAYQINGIDGSYTSVNSGSALTSGTEYAINQSGRSISIKVTLNKGTSTAGPTLKRVYVRAAPIQQSFRLDNITLDLSGRDGKSMVRLRNGGDHTLDGFSQAANLRASAMSTSPVSITDRFGTFTGVLEPDGFELTEIRPEEFLARLKIRET